MAQLDEAGWASLSAAVADPLTVERYRSKVVTVPGSSCWLWVGAISGRGHGRFWTGPGRVTIAHRYGYALALGIDALRGTQVLAHRCDNPLCQRVGPEHVVASTARENAREYAARRRLAGAPVADPRGSRVRARELRDLARIDPALMAAELAALRARYGVQLGLW